MNKLWKRCRISFIYSSRGIALLSIPRDGNKNISLKLQKQFRNESGESQIEIFQNFKVNSDIAKRSSVAKATSGPSNEIIKTA